MTWNTFPDLFVTQLAKSSSNYTWNKTIYLQGQTSVSRFSCYSKKALQLAFMREFSHIWQRLNLSPNLHPCCFSTFYNRNGLPWVYPILSDGVAIEVSDWLHCKGKPPAKGFVSTLAAEVHLVDRMLNIHLPLPWYVFPSISTSYDSMTSWMDSPISHRRTSIPAHWERSSTLGQWRKNRCTQKEIFASWKTL